MTRPDRRLDESFYFEPAVETLGRDALAGLQFDRLTATLAHVYERVPHFTKAFDKAGVKPADLQSLADDSLAKRSKAVRHHVKSMVGVTCDVTVKRPGEVPRSQDKAVRVRDLREA